MSRTIPTKPNEITLETLPQLFAHHRAVFGGSSMEEPAAPQRPDDVPQETWDALGDPGKNALTRERAARQEAERARDTAVRERDAARARPAPPSGAGSTGPGAGVGGETSKTDQPAQANGSGETDIASIVRQAVDAAIKPFQDRDAHRDAEIAAGRVRDAVLEAAKPLLHDASDALVNVDLTTLVDEQGRADTEKIKSALDHVITTKPHLARTATRIAPLGIGNHGSGGAGPTEAERVKLILAEMQSTAGVRAPAPLI